MNSIKRSFSIVLAMALVVSMLVFAQPVLAASNMTLQQLQAKFPAGAYWNHYVNNTSEAADYLFSVGDNRFADSISWQPCASHSSSDLNYYVGKYDCNVFNGGMQCFGFARKLGYDAFGTYPSSWTKAYNMDNLKPGDIVRYMNDGHSIFVTGVNGDTVTYADCNYGCTCIIRWNQTTTKSAIAGNGFDYVESAPSTLSVSTISPSVSIDTGSWRYSIGSTNAVVCANINNPNGGTISTIGCHLYNGEDEYIYCHSEEVNPSYKNATTVPMWTDFNADVHYYLQPGTKYQYRLYAYIDGVEYRSELASFTTTGTPPSVVLDNTSPKYQITENNAVLFANINNPYVGKIGVVGCHLYNSQGNYIFHHYEEINSDLALNTSVPFTVDLLQDAGYILQPNTTYQYRLYAYINDMKYTSELASFTTASTNKPPVSSDDPSIPNQPSVPQPPVETPFMGDLDDDGNIDAKDALEVLKASVGKANLTEQQKTVADVNKDGYINAKDALEILKHSVGKPSALDTKA